MNFLDADIASIAWDYNDVEGFKVNGKYKLEASGVYPDNSVVSENVILQLKAMNLNVDRISGDDRYSTSLEIAKRLSNVSEIAVVNGVTGLADAVSIAPVAANRNMPIVLSSPNEGTKTFDEFIKSNKDTLERVLKDFFKDLRKMKKENTNETKVE